MARVEEEGTLSLGFRIVAPHFVAGGEVRNGVCIRAAPIIGYMLGWTRQEIREYCRIKGWLVKKLPSGGDTNDV